LFSLLPIGFQKWKLACGLVIVAGLLLLNLRGMKEAIRVLLPVFLGFVVTHVVLIVYGILRTPGLRAAGAGNVRRDPATPRAAMGWDAARRVPAARVRARWRHVHRSRRPCRTTSTCSPNRACTPAS
jgi:hypothetical protein